MAESETLPLFRSATQVSGLLTVIAGRWSPRAFDPKPVEPEALHRIFEAARWAASSFNEQPWRFFLALRRDPHRAKLESFLVEANAWAKNAPVLMLAATSTIFARNGKSNTVAVHDLGLADATMTIQAMQEGVLVHGMAGFDAARAQTELAMPGDWRAIAMWAMGYPGSLDALPEQLRARELEPRARRPLSQTIFASRTGETHPLFQG
jgi:nitroreductase